VSLWPSVIDSAVSSFFLFIGSILILIKCDRDYVTILEGKCFKKRKNIKTASKLYKQKISNVQFVFVGTGGISFGIALSIFIEFSDQYVIFTIIFSLMGIVMFLLGIWGRTRAFLEVGKMLE
jgi:hypothetical protein